MTDGTNVSTTRGLLYPRSEWMGVEVYPRSREKNWSGPGQLPSQASTGFGSAKAQGRSRAGYLRLHLHLHLHLHLRYLSAAMIRAATFGLNCT